MYVVYVYVWYVSMNHIMTIPTRRCTGRIFELCQKSRHFPPHHHSTPPKPNPTHTPTLPHQYTLSSRRRLYGSKRVCLCVFVPHPAFSTLNTHGCNPRFRWQKQKKKQKNCNNNKHNKNNNNNTNIRSKTGKRSSGGDGGHGSLAASPPAR